MANIRDVAQAAGVSISTVSLCLTNSGPVSAETRAKVEAAAEKVGYTPNVMAQGLRRGRNKLVGIMLGDVANPFFGRLLGQIDEIISATDHMLIVAITGFDRDREIRALNQLRRHRVAGILMAPLSNEAELATQLKRLDVPIVLIDQRVEGVRQDFVGSDNVMATRLLTEYLIRMGHQKICYLGGQPNLLNSRLRVEGFREAMQAAGMHTDASAELTADFSAEKAYDQIIRIMSMPNRPTAIVAASNMMALGALQAINDLGFKCPDDISLCGVDDVPWGGIIQPRITTVAQPIDELARISANWLLERMIGRGGAARTHLAIPKLIVGSSCAPPKEGRR